MLEKDISIMNRLLIFFLGFSLSALGQSNSDYDTYSLLINERIIDWKMDMDTIPHVIVVNNLTRFSKDSSTIAIIDEMIAKDKSLAYTLLHFYDKPIDLLNNSEFILLLNNFKSKIFEQTDLQADSFKLKIPMKIEIAQRIEKIFDVKRIKGWDKAWNKFYKIYPKSPGYFEFSKVAFSDNFAIVYIVHRAKPLVGSGGLEILINKNGTWKELAYYGIWNN
jgi:hypothetical protein